MKAIVLFVLFFYSLSSYSSWSKNSKVASYLKIPTAITSSSLVMSTSPLTLNLGVVPKGCYIKEDQTASRDLLFLYYPVDKYKYQFDPEKITVFIDGQPLSKVYSDIIGTHFMEEEIFTVGANYEMNAPFGELFKRGSKLSIQDNKTQKIVAEFDLKNTYRSYTNADINCRKNIHNTYYLHKKSSYSSNTRNTLVPVPQEVAQKYKNQQSKKSGKHWTLAQKNVVQYLNSNIWALVYKPDMNSEPYSFYSCNENINIVIGIKPQVTSEQVFNVNYFLQSKNTGESVQLRANSNRILNPGAYVYLSLSNSIYKNLDPEDTYVIKAVGTNAERYTPGDSFKFKLANLPHVLSEIGKECAELEAQYNVKVIQNQLNGFPKNVIHPAFRNDQYGPATAKKFKEIAQWMRKYNLSNTYAYYALNDAINFYNSYYGCQKVNYSDASSMSEYELKEQIECNKSIAQTAASNGYQSAFYSAKSSVETIVYELKNRNSNTGFFSGLLQGLVGAAGQIAGIEYGQDFSDISSSINSYIRNDSYMIQMNKHVYDINQYNQYSNVESGNSSGSSSSSSSGTDSSGLRSVNSGDAASFRDVLNSGNYTCSGPESQNMQAYLGQVFTNNIDVADKNNMCDLSRVAAEEIKKLLPYVSRCMPSDLSMYQEHVTALEERSKGSCVN